MKSSQVLARRALARFPRLYLNIMSWRANRLIARLERQWQCDRVALDVIARYGPRSIAGPFRGLAFPRSTWRRHITPKLLGTYESELHDAVEACCGRRYQRVIDIGAADGYYAVGLAKRLGQTVVAFESDPWSRHVSRQAAALNGVSVEMHGAATPRALARVLEPRSLVLCDCEGAEDVLLDPAAIPALASCDLIIEVHENFVPGLRARLCERFAATHRVRYVEARANKESPAAISEMTAADRTLAVNEHRGQGCDWLVCDSKATALSG